MTERWSIPPDRRIDVVVECVLPALLVFMPFAFGAVERWSELVVVLMAAVLGGCAALKAATRRDGGRLPALIIIPVAAFLLLVLLQLAPLNTSWVHAISPQTVAEKSALLSDTPGGVPERMMLSFYSWGTRHDLEIVLMAVAVLAAVTQIYRTSAQIKRLLTIIVCIGAAAALLALAQDLSGADKIYWSVYTPLDRASAGPFVFYSHYSQFMNLSIGAALGLMLVRLLERFGRRGLTVPALVAARGEPAMRLVWALLAFVVLGATSVLLSFSRGGVVAMLAAFVLFVLLTSARYGLRGRGWILGCVGLVLFSAVLYLGFDTVYARMASLGRFHQSEGGRIEMLRDMTAVFRRFPIFGTGLGTHEVVYPQFDHSTTLNVATHAENEYAQLLEETGFIGLGLLAAFIVLVSRGLLQSLQHGAPPICAAALGLTFGLCAVMIHSLSDFGQHLPANAALSAVFCGLLLNLGAIGRGAKKQRSAVAASPASPALQTSWAVHSLGWAGLAACVALFSWAIPWANAAQQAETHLVEARQVEDGLRQHDWEGTNDQYADLISECATASQIDPENIKIRYALASYRWYALSRITDAKSGDLLLTNEQMQFAARLVSDLLEDRRVCPTFAPPYSLAGQIEQFVLSRTTSGAFHIREGYALGPAYPITCLAAARVDAADGRAQDAMIKLRRCVALDPQMLSQAIDTCTEEMHHPEMALDLAGHDLHELLQVIAVMELPAQRDDRVAAVRSQAIARARGLEITDETTPDDLAAMAGLYVRDRDYPKAIGLYGRALDRQYSQVYWRLALARCLAADGKTEEAMRHAKICLRLRPDSPEARQLIQNLSVAPSALSRN